MRNCLPGLYWGAPREHHTIDRDRTIDSFETPDPEVLDRINELVLEVVRDLLRQGDTLWFRDREYPGRNVHRVPEDVRIPTFYIPEVDPDPK
jgi:hypothetical protein